MTLDDVLIGGGETRQPTRDGGHYSSRIRTAMNALAACPTKHHNDAYLRLAAAARYRPQAACCPKPPYRCFRWRMACRLTLAPRLAYHLFINATPAYLLHYRVRNCRWWRATEGVVQRVGGRS